MIIFALTKNIKLMKLVFTFVFLSVFSFYGETEQQIKDCHAFDKSGLAGAYVSGNKISYWVKRGGEEVVISTTTGDCNDLRAYAAENDMSYIPPKN